MKTEIITKMLRTIITKIKYKLRRFKMENEEIQNNQEESTRLPTWEQKTKIERIEITTGAVTNPVNLVLENKTVADIQKILKYFN